MNRHADIAAQSQPLLAEAVASLRGHRVLVAPLDWGLGHATRCIPLVRALLAAGKEVLLAADRAPYELLRQAFPELQILRFSGIQVHYRAKGSQAAALLWQLPNILSAIRREHKELRRIVADYAIDTVVSDNRFGLWCRGVETVYITHQLLIKLPKRLKGFEPLGHWVHGRIIARFSACWVPDVAGDGNLSGDLSHRYPLPRNGRFIGILSRFAAPTTTTQSPYTTIAVLSGPEPQRSLYEERLIARFRASGEPCLIVQGLPKSEPTWQQEANLSLVSHLDSAQLAQLLAATPRIYCRSGYTTLMDLAALGRKATLTPTPGQSEQIYLATIATQNGHNILPQSEV